MVKITLSDDFGKTVDLRLSNDSLQMISCFLHYVNFANHSLYDSADRLRTNVSAFYDSDYPESFFKDARFLCFVIDFFIDNLS